MSTAPALSEIVRSLLASQPLGILATQAHGEPYCNLVAFTPSDDLKALLIATPRFTAKYNNMLEHPAVSLLVDNRCGASPDFNGGIAVNCIGRATAVAEEAFEKARQRHFQRHTALRAHLDTPDCALVSIAVERYVIARGVLHNEVLIMS
jgi:hypothetical protein